MVSYGLAYGMEAYGLGQRLSIPTEEAQVILDAYFEAFPAVRDYMDQTVAEARERGYTETLFGRRRQIPELSSSNFRIRQAGERQAMNAGIQGLAADIFKVALVRLDAGPRGRRVREPAHPAGARRGPRRGRAGRARRGHRGGARRHVGRVRPAGAARGEPVVRPDLGRRQGRLIADRGVRLSPPMPLRLGRRTMAQRFVRCRGRCERRLVVAKTQRGTWWFFVLLVVLLLLVWYGVSAVTTDECSEDCATRVAVVPAEVGVPATAVSRAIGPGSGDPA